VPELLVEVGFEEMPAAWLPGLTEQARQRFSELCTESRLDPRNVRSFSTPRRLVVVAEVVARQADSEEQVWGPALKVAKDQGGAWTKAAEGFAKKCGVPVETLQSASKAAGADPSLLFVRRVEGRSTRDVLPGTLASWLRALAFPKRMSWDAWIDDGKGTFPFGRPIRWLVVLLAGDVVPFAIHEAVAGAKGAVIVETGRVTYGHRFLPKGRAGAALPVRSFAELQAQLREHFVILDPQEREARLRQGLSVEHELIDEWPHLVEYPTVVTGVIPPEFHGLPREVLETVLVHHQKYVPLLTDGQVTRFAALTNTDGSAAEEIVRGMERVVVARLRDAAFFFAEDVKRPLAARVDDLQGVVFHRGLGTYKDKSERMAALVDHMGQAGVLGKAEQAAAREAARLAKADLTTLMVREFPELQGIMGAIYLGAQGGVPREVASAVRWHYHPVSIEEDAAPAGALDAAEARVFAAVSLADKLDTLAGYFGMGENPTGSRDPYGLRRAAQGAIRVVLDFWRPETGGTRPNLEQLVAKAIEGYGGSLKVEAKKAQGVVELFLLERLEYVFVSRGFPPDEVAAVVHARGTNALADPGDCLLRVQALHKVRLEATADFDQLAIAFKRARNILDSGGPPASVEEHLLQEEAERELHAAVGRVQGNGDYEARLRSLAALRGPVDRFFDDVLVMAEDPKVRANRLGLLSQALSLFYRIADISKLGG
jgi:glycyl-tRNA synthetase beta chain